MIDRRPLKPRTDVAKLLNLTGSATQLLVALFVITQIVLFASTAGDVTRPWVSAIALILVIGAAILITRPGPYPLRLNSTFITVAVVATSTALVSWQLPDSGWPGYASWHLGANTFLLLGLGLRGRSGWAWIGMAAMVGVTVLWTTSTGQGLLAGINLVDRQAGTLLIGTIFAIGLSRTARRIDEFNDTESRRAADQAALEAGNEERSKQFARLDTGARPALELIAGQGPLAQHERDEFLILEAALRDGIRARALSREPLSTFAREARRRGVEVVFLDDSESHDHTPDEEERIAGWVASQLCEVNTGRFTARVLPFGRAKVASIVHENSQGTSQSELAVLKQTRNVLSDLVAHLETPMTS